MGQHCTGVYEGTGAMDKNLGREDRTVRIVVAIGLAVLIYLGVLPGVAAIVAGVIAAYLLITGVLARCVLYKLADIDTSIQEQPYSTTDDRAGL
jgi:divalent metal cation (Fe/Co/Zn/Cd) transporter